MKKQGKKSSINRDDAPLTVKELKAARPLRDVFPDLAAWGQRERAKKGAPRKEAVSLRLSPEVIAYFKKQGAGWQTRIDRTLKAFVESDR